MNYAGIIDKAIDCRLNGRSASILHHTAQTAVYKVDEFKPYAVRVDTRESPDHAIRLSILQEVGSLDGRVATILHSETRMIGEQKCTIDVMPFLSGAALDHFPSAEETLGIIEAMHALYQGLKMASPGFMESGIPCLSDVIHGLFAAAAPGSMRSRAEMLLRDKRLAQLLASEDRCLIYGDPWVSNFLIEQGIDSVRVRIVDIDPLLIGPDILQPALLFSAYFVTSFILFGDEGRRPDLDALIEAWPEKLDRMDTIKMMRVYPILLSLVKLAESAGGSHDRTAVSAADLGLLERCLEVIDSYA